MKPRPILLEQSGKEFYTSHSGLTFLGQAIRLACLEGRLAALGRYVGISHKDMVATYLGLLCQGKSDFEAAEGVRNDRYFQAAVGLDHRAVGCGEARTAPFAANADTIDAVHCRSPASYIFDHLERITARQVGLRHEALHHGAEGSPNGRVVAAACWASSLSPTLM